jgi:hypothetical protein
MQVLSPPEVGGSINGVAALDDGLVAYYSFDDGTATDNSGNGNDGRVFGATPTGGVLGNALYFNGSSDYVAVPHSSTLNLNSEFTISGWVKPVAPFAGYVPILTKGNTDDLSTPYAVVYTWTLVPHVRFTSSGGRLVLVDLPISDSLILRNWNCFVWRFAGGNLEIFRVGGARSWHRDSGCT